METTLPQKRVAVVGFGIAGAAVAALLARAGHRVTAFERAADLRTEGGGIVVQPAGQRVLDRLEILAAVRSRAAVITRLTATRSGGRPLIDLDYAEVAPGCVALGMRRGCLAEALHAAALRAGVEVRFGRPVEAATQTATGVTLRGAGPTPGPFDLVVATDGVHSRLRAASPAPARATRYGSLWVTVRAESGPTGVQRHYLRGGQLLGLLPVGGGQTTLFWGIRRVGLDAWRRGGLGRWKAEVAAVSPEAGPVLDAIDSLDQVRFALHAEVVLDRWVDGRVVFLGDAAHAMSPHLGQGASLALGDAARLASALAAFPRWEDALRDFAHARQRHVRFYSQVLRLLTPLLDGPPGPLAWCRDRALRWSSQQPRLRREMLAGVVGAKSGWLPAPARVAHESKPAGPIQPLEERRGRSPGSGGLTAPGARPGRRGRP